MSMGDHLRVKRWKGVYAHHGIDMGDGTVVHFSGEPLQWRGARVVREPLEIFLCGASLEFVVYHEEMRAPEEVVAAALEGLDTQDYHLWRNNCEHFACYCKTGLKQSKQVKRVLATAAITVVSASAILAAVTIRVAAKRALQTRA